MGETKQYPSMYFMNNSGGDKMRELLPGQYFTIIQPNETAVGQGAESGYRHAILFSDYDKTNLTKQVNSFLRKNTDKIDFYESNRLVNMVASHKSTMPQDLATGRSYAEISDYLKQGSSIPVAKTMRSGFVGPKNGRWFVSDTSVDDVLYGNEKKAHPLSYAWWH
mgnify:CR=1 FL=1